MKATIEEGSDSVVFSIGIPVCKSTYLVECISSVLSQTYTAFELIIVNDNLLEPIDEIVSSFEDARIKYFKNATKIGAKEVVDNWNKCLEHAKGDYFVLLGDDDRLEPEYLEAFIQLITRYPNLNVYHCRSKIINAHSQVIGLTNSWPEFESVYENMWHRINFFRLQYVSDFMYRTEFLKWNGGYYKLPLAWGSDEITAYQAMEVKGIAHTQRPVFCYRQNTQTISNTGNISWKLEAVLGEAKWLSSFLEKKPLDNVDVMLHDNIKRYLNTYIQKKKRLTLTQSGTLSLFGNVFVYWKKYGCSFTDIVFALLKKSKSFLTKGSNKL